METCVVFVSNHAYIDKFYDTCRSLLTVGEYKSDIVLIVGNDVQVEGIENNEFITSNRIYVLKIPDITFSDHIIFQMNNIKSDGRTIERRFQWHKLHVFNTYFKQWKKVLYIDCGMQIFEPIQPIFDLLEPNKIMAHQDSYPSFELDLSSQFDTTMDSYRIMKKIFDMSTRNYFQTGIMLFDTSILTDTICQDLYDLACLFPISKTNEQGIINLFFIFITKQYVPLPTSNNNTYYYDFKRRFPDKPYIMYKY